MSVEDRKDDEMGVRVGDGIGYSICFEYCTAEKTVIEHMSDGILLQNFMTKPDVAVYAAIIIDESHDFTLSTDILRGLVKVPVESFQSISYILQTLTAQHAIEGVQEILEETPRDLANGIGVLGICAICANLLAEMHAKICEPTADKARKVGLSTNISETSITINGVVYAIDPGLVKENPYNPCPATQSLLVVPCFCAAASHRAGRAGHVAPGKSF
ncbi:hypothetical protein O181_075279 [Austropuccinia psidii MF-1]|uniref:Helicase C-terminal domain-containing protein n=1 Tax=Austropuccinia psidii MF-1 TaxID=1389203 RepID=A0A9Q3FAQ4_9BASI|nr:hypothetical protein [Austropuccinia psidii MF-1]